MIQEKILKDDFFEINREIKKEKEWRRRNRFNPFIKFGQTQTYNFPDVMEIAEQKRQDQEDLEYAHKDDDDGGYELWLNSANPYTNYNEIDELFDKVRDYENHWLIGRVIQLWEIFSHIRRFGFLDTIRFTRGGW